MVRKLEARPFYSSKFEQDSEAAQIPAAQLSTICDGQRDLFHSF
jgi:hypothetical protein